MLICVSFIYSGILNIHLYESDYKLSSNCACVFIFCRWLAHRNLLNKSIGTLWWLSSAKTIIVYNTRTYYCNRQKLRCFLWLTETFKQMMTVSSNFPLSRNVQLDLVSNTFLLHWNLTSAVICNLPCAVMNSKFDDDNRENYLNSDILKIAIDCRRELKPLKWKY